MKNLVSLQLMATKVSNLSALASLTKLTDLDNAVGAKDHTNRMEVCRALCGDLISELRAGRYQAREEYVAALERYLTRLPDRPGDGNILLADAEARTLRNLFGAESNILSVAFSSKLKTYLEQHIGLRVF
jgi:hypothetical protein